MKKNLVYFFACLILVFSSNSCLKYKELSKIGGLEMDVQGATPLFSYELTIQDLLFKSIGFDSTQLTVNATNKIYFWRQNLPLVNSMVSISDSLSKNIPINDFSGKDSVSYLTSGLAGIGDILGPLTLGPNFSFTFPVRQGRMFLQDNAINIVGLNNFSGKIKLKATNSYLFPVRITITFPELVGVGPVTIATTNDTLERLSSVSTEIDITNANWIGTDANIINYEMTVTLINPEGKTSTNSNETSNVQNANTKVEDTLSVENYGIIFGDVGKNRYLFKDSIKQKINITDPFILNPNNNSSFPDLNLTINYQNHTLGIDANAVMYDAYFKMKDGSLKQMLFFDNRTNTYTQDTFVFPSKINPMPTVNSPTPEAISFSLDTANTNFHELNLNLRELDSFFYNVKLYSPQDGSSQGNSAFIHQPNSLNFVNSASGILFIPYIFKSEIFIDTSETSVVNIPEQFYKDIENIIKDRNSTGELQEMDLSMTVENNTIFDITPQVYFMNNNIIIDSFSSNQVISAATLSVGGIVRIPHTATIIKKLTPTQWENLKQCNRLTSNIFLKTSSQNAFPAITSDMYVKFFFKIENIGFKYLIKKE